MVFKNKTYYKNVCYPFRFQFQFQFQFRFPTVFCLKKTCFSNFFYLCQDEIKVSHTAYQSATAGFWKFGCDRFRNAVQRAFRYGVLFRGIGKYSRLLL